MIMGCIQNKHIFFSTCRCTKERYFLIIADVQKYPVILHDNFVSVQIIHNTNNTMFTDEEIIKSFDIKFA